MLQHEPPEKLDHYDILRKDDHSLWELGRGGMGVTYKAFDTKLRVFVALKVINPDLREKKNFRERFVREARAAASLRHGNVATVYHLANDEQICFYAMEFIEGITLEKFIKENGRQDWRKALSLVRQVTAALIAAHRQKIVHRDLKPANLMLAEGEGLDAPVVKVIDFGLAKAWSEVCENDLTEPGVIWGSKYYSSPEQLGGESLDSRSDIYSLGIVLWYALAGSRPHNDKSNFICGLYLEAPLPWNQMETIPPRSVCNLLTKMLAKDPDDRPQTPGDLLGEIERCLAEPVGQHATTSLLENSALSIDDAAPTEPDIRIQSDSAFPTDIRSEATASTQAADRTAPTILTAHSDEALPTSLLATEQQGASAVQDTTVEVTRFVNAALKEIFGQPPRVLDPAEFNPFVQAEICSALCDIAAIQGIAGNRRASLRTLKSALRFALHSDRHSRLPRELMKIAVSKHEAGNTRGARASLLRLLRGIEDRRYGSGDIEIEIAGAQAACGQVEDAMQTANNLFSQEERTRVLVAIAKARIHAGDMVAAHKALVLGLRISCAPRADRIDSPEPMLASIGVALVKVGDLRGAGEALKSMGTGSMHHDKNCLLVILAAGQAKAREFEAARKTIDSITLADGRVSAMCAVAVEWFRSLPASSRPKSRRYVSPPHYSRFLTWFRRKIGLPKNEPAHLQLLDAAHECARQLGAGHRAAEAWYQIGTAEANTGNPEESHRALLEARRRQAIKLPNRSDGGSLLRHFAVAAAADGDFEDAHRTAIKIWTPGIQKQTWCDIARLEAKAGEFDAAMETVRHLQSEWDRARAYCAVARAIQRTDTHSPLAEISAQHSSTRESLSSSFPSTIWKREPLSPA